jgi:two-component system CitB family sensor kinase
MRLPRPKTASIATQVLLMQVVLVVLLVAGGSTAAVLEARSSADSGAKRQVLSMAESFAEAPRTAAALAGPDPSAVLQPLTENLRKEAGVDFVVVMNPQGIRYTHPNPALIGRPFVGHIAEAQAGRPFTETYAGSLGPSVRSVVPVRDGAGRIVGLVSVGITQQRLSALLSSRLPAVAGLSALALALAALGAYAVGRRVRRQTMGLGPVHLAELYEHHDAVMHAMREGLLLFDTEGRLILANDEAVRLLDLPADRTGRRPSELAVAGSLGRVLAEGHDAADEIHLTATRVLTVNQSTVRRRGRELGKVVTLRDRTELQALTDELASVRGFAEALRASNHEAANRLHTVVTLIELDRSGDAVRFATTELATHQELVDRIMGAVEEPVLAALLLGKVTQARERGVELTVGDTTAVHRLPLPVTDAVTLVGNLIDNAVEAVAGLDADAVKQVTVEVWDDDAGLCVRVSDNGPGVPPQRVAEVFRHGYTTKGSPGHGLGLALVDQIVRRRTGRVEVGANEGGGAVFEVLIPRQAANQTVGR